MNERQLINQSNTSCSFAINPKHLSFTESSPANSCMSLEEGSMNHLDSSYKLPRVNGHYAGNNPLMDDSPFVQFRIPSTQSKKLNFHPDFMSPAIKMRMNFTPNASDVSFPESCSPPLSPMMVDSFCSSRSRLVKMDKHSSRTTSTPNNSTRDGRWRFSNDQGDDSSENLRRNLFREVQVKDISMNEAGEEAKDRSATGLSWNEGMSNLIGDMSAPFKLPLHSGKHVDLKSISSDTMADVLGGKYDDVISRKIVVDCRYPYEFEGGHIKDAINIFNQDVLLSELFNPPSQESLVIIFHCEFSSERAPKMMRFLRNFDRDHNQANYPTLCYPELYLLDGGYSTFYNIHPTICEPQSYRPMLDPDYAEELTVMQTKRRTVQEEIAKNAIRQKFNH